MRSIGFNTKKIILLFTLLVIFSYFLTENSKIVKPKPENIQKPISIVKHDIKSKFIRYQCQNFCGGWADRLKGNFIFQLE